jgi:hypothetical protein
MKNNLLNKATALVMASVAIFSGQALAISSNNNQELTNAEPLNESELLIAAANDPLTEEDQEAGAGVAVVVGVAVEAMGQVFTQIEAVAVKETIPSRFIPFVRDALDKALGATAEAQSVAKKDQNSSVVQVLAVAISSLGQASEAVATGDAGNAKAQVSAAIEKGKEAKVIAEGQASGG